MLQDENVLLNVLRQFEGQETHTIHLVFTPKINSARKDTRKTFARPTTNEATGINLRQRTSTQQPTNIIPNTTFNESNFVYTNSNDTSVDQQNAFQNWMLQTYAQYMSQYMNM